jgi:hypothetical protein
MKELFAFHFKALLLLGLILLMVHVGFSQGKPDSTTTISIPKVIEQVKAWQKRLAEIEIEKRQLEGAISAAQVFFNDSTFAKKGVTK